MGRVDQTRESMRMYEMHVYNANGKGKLFGILGEEHGWGREDGGS